MTIRNAEEFARLRRSKNPDDYRRAIHESGSTEVWLDVIDRFPDLRQWVAQNKTVPVEVLEILASDPDNNVRFVVAMKRKTTARILSHLSMDDDEAVRLRVAMHRNTPKDVLKILVNDSWHQVREQAKMQLAEREETG